MPAFGERRMTLDRELICHGRVRCGKGMILMTWNNAHLFASSDDLLITQAFMGRIELPSKKVAGLSAVGSIPYFTRGVRIHHLLSDYSPVIIFKTLEDPGMIIERIAETGFKCTGREGATRCLQCGSEIPEDKTKCAKCGWSYEH